MAAAVISAAFFSALDPWLPRSLEPVVAHGFVVPLFVLLWLLIGENIVAISPRAVRYAPGHVFGAIVTAHTHGSSDTLGVWPAVALGVVYAAILFVLGAFVVLGSDAPSSGD